jgi:hypothetical protein
VKNQPKKKGLAAPVKKKSKKKETPVVRKKQSQKREIAAVVDIHPEKKGISSTVKKRPKKKEASVVVKTQPSKDKLSPSLKKESQKKGLPVVNLGTRYKCYKCSMKFYDLGRPQPLCPSCGANQNDDESKGMNKRKRRRRSTFMGKTEPHIIAPEERDDVIEVVSEVDAEYVLDVEDIVLEEHQDTEKSE